MCYGIHYVSGVAWHADLQLQKLFTLLDLFYSSVPSFTPFDVRQF